MYKAKCVDCTDHLASKIKTLSVFSTTVVLRELPHTFTLSFSRIDRFG